MASYVALPTEPSTIELNREFTRRGFKVIVPRLREDKDLDWAPLVGDRAGQSALGMDAIAMADLIVVPALQVDCMGYRLGQGGGSYDRSLARCPEGALVVAVVDEDGVVPSVPRQAHDSRVNAVVRAGKDWLPLPWLGSL